MENPLDKIENADDYETQMRLCKESARVEREYWQAQDRKHLYANKSYPHNEDNLLRISRYLRSSSDSK